MLFVSHLWCLVNLFLSTQDFPLHKLPKEAGGGGHLLFITGRVVFVCF